MKKSEDIDSYIKSFPKDTQIILNKVRATIKKVAPKAEETISYGIPTFKLNGNLVHFGGFKNHIGFFRYSQIQKRIKIIQDIQGHNPVSIKRPYTLSINIKNHEIPPRREFKKEII